MRKVLVTGAMGGIGQSICREFLKKGYRVAAHVRSLDKRVEAFKEEAREMGMEENLEFVLADLTSPKELEDMMKDLLSRWKNLHVLVNNGGITRDRLVLQMSYEDFDQVINTNLKAAFVLSKIASRAMMRQKQGKIINISSVVGLHGNIAQANYAAAKGALIAMSKSFAKEFASRNVQVNAIAPGFIETKMTQELGEEIQKAFLERIPLKRFGKPEEVAALVLFLSGESSDYITGQTFVIDGGMSI